jgi:outer membrane protein
MKKSFVFITACLMLIPAALSAQQHAWSLEECVRYAIDNNIQIKQQNVQTKVQKNTLDMAKLGLLPTLNGQARHDYSFGRALDQNTYQFYNQTLLSDYLYVGGSMDIFKGLQNLNTIKKDKFALLAGEQDLQYIKDNVALNVALAYLQVLLSRELVGVNQNQLDITRQQIEKTRKLVDAGSMAKGNLLTIEAQAAQEELSLINVKNQLDLSYLNLTQLLELPTPEGFEIVVPEISVEPNAEVSGDIDGIYKIALDARPEIKSSELKLTASQYDLKIAKGGRSPSVSLNHSYGTRYTYINNIPGQMSYQEQLKNNASYGVGISLNVPILNGWQVNKNISNSKLAVENSRYSLEASKKQLYKDIQQAYTDAEASLKKFNASSKAVSSTEESFRYTEQKFNVGMLTPVDYNAAKTQLLNAQSDMSQAKYEFLFKTKVLDFYKGLPLNLNK